MFSKNKALIYKRFVAFFFTNQHAISPPVSTLTIPNVLSEGEGGPGACKVIPLGTERMKYATVMDNTMACMVTFLTLARGSKNVGPCLDA